MIYTVTFNPALDYVVGVERLTLGEVNRTTKESIYYGGKGINVSAVLKELKVESIALGFVAGFTGDAIERGVKEKGIATDFIHLKEGMSRINVKIKSDQESEINGQGPEITKEAIELLFEKLDQLKEGDSLVLAGSIPKTLPSDIYERIMERLQEKKIRVIVDATKDLLLNVLKYKPFLIKPNNHELGEMFGVILKTNEEIISYGKKLQDMGSKNVLVSMAGDGSILIDETGNVYQMGVPAGKVKNSVGAGDSMVAGFLAGYAETNNYEEALKLGTATGSATAFSEGLATYEKIMELRSQL
ncbi:MAG: 1-phosphofructokinase [Clostridiales bacterium]|nr:1-phosphofructokinase [Clostridiales bacterium]